MKIKEILSQTRRDFQAIYICEHCKCECKMSGYDDTNYHQKILPKMKCKECGKASPDDYRPLTTKYPDNVQL